MSPEQMRKKDEARKESMKHENDSIVNRRDNKDHEDHKNDQMKRDMK